MGKLQVIVGGQYGSEGKGAVAAYLAAVERRPLVGVRVAGPNAGHSVVDATGKKWKLQAVPVSAVTNLDAELYLAAGSEINPGILQKEIDDLEAAGFRVKDRIAWDTQATVIKQEYLDLEHGGSGTAHGEGGLTKAIGSTGEGIGAARSARIMRQAELIGGGVDVATRLRDALKANKTVQLECTQGYALGLHMGHYPKCTSSDCRAVDFMAMAGISPWADYVTDLEIWIVLRSYPIRVAGDSGYMLQETTWDAVGVEPEHTTVTKKVRRVGIWDTKLAAAAVAANGGPSDSVRVAYTFADYNNKDWAGMNEAGAWLAQPGAYSWVKNKEVECDCPIGLVGTGPNSIVDLRGLWKNG